MPANPVDVHVGARIRERRRELGMSQQGLADHLGLTFQQVQKYERGANRVSASVLWSISGRLGVSATYFFQGLPTDGTPISHDQIDLYGLLAMPHGGEIVRLFLTIPPAMRESVRSLMQSCVDVLKLGDA